MPEVTANNESWKGRLFYDGTCRFCCGWIDRIRPVLDRVSVLTVPFTEGAAEPEMRLHWHDGREFGGADAAIFLAGRIWWARPFALVSHLPGARHLADVGYRRLAARRHCLNGACALPIAKTPPSPLSLAVGWSLAALLVLTAIVLSIWMFPGETSTDGWWTMWLIAFALWLGFKGITWSRCVPRASFNYLLWPGMDAQAFTPSHRPGHNLARGVLFSASAFLIAGLALVGLIFPRVLESGFPVLAGWIAMIALVSTLHFGLFAFMAFGWNRFGYPVKPIMNAPWRATSLGNFWGDRWNRAFSLFARLAMFRPLVRRLGIRAGTLAGFLLSGIAHELVISLPARAGWGLPTLYFLIQGGGVLLERALFRNGQGGVGQRAFTWATILLPAPLLFPVPFMEKVLLPGFNLF